MSVAIKIAVADQATPVVRAVSRTLAPAAINPVIGRSARNTIREHFFGLNSSRPNQLGGRRTNYYTGAGRGTQFQIVSESEVVVSVNQIGIVQRFYGGTITPKASKYLTIPVHPAAHGKRAREFDLELVFGPGGRPIALATKGGKKSRVGEIYYRLVKSVTQQPDRTVLPDNELIVRRINKDVTDVVNTAIARARGQQNGGSTT